MWPTSCLAKSSAANTSGRLWESRISGHWANCTTRLKLLVERRVLVAEQDDQGPDCEGGSEGKFEQVEDGSDDGDQATPLRVLHQAPSCCQGQSGPDHEEEPDQMHKGWGQEERRHVAVHPGAMHPGTETS